MPYTIGQLVEASGVSRSVINSWIDRKIPRTPMAATSERVRREFSRENALEIAFMGALALHGVEPHDAAIEAGFLMLDEGNGKLGRFWVSNPRREFNRTSGRIGRIISKDLPFSTLAQEASFVQLPSDPDGEDTPALSLTIIDIAAIVRRVDQLMGA